MLCQAHAGQTAKYYLLMQDRSRERSSSRRFNTQSYDIIKRENHSQHYHLLCVREGSSAQWILCSFLFFCLFIRCGKKNCLKKGL